MSKKINKYANENFNEQLLTSSFLAEKNIRVLKHNETFGIFDRYGDITKRDEGEQGLYHAGTRFLSRCEFLVCGKRPLLLSSFITEDNATLMVDLTNPDIDQGRIPSGAIHILRSIFLWNMCRYEFLSFYNYLNESLFLNINFIHEADYCDIFEVRGHKRARHGSLQEPILRDGKLIFQYLGLDDTLRYTVITAASQTLEFKDASLGMVMSIPARGRAITELSYSLSLEQEPEENRFSFEEGFRRSKEEVALQRENHAHISTSNELFNDLINRSLADINLLITSTKWGPYPYAGVPWFSAPFGRDGIITALEMLWINPQLAKAVLHFLSETQGTKLDTENDCEPGKIIHEARQGEMANLGEIPFKHYYGSVDATPLYILLAGAYYKRTGDRDFVKSIWPNIKASLDWVDQFGDCDQDGFIEYFSRSSKGLTQQGWKDSDNSVFHSDGELAEGPIAICEVQGYLYSALKRAAHLAYDFGERDLSRHLIEKMHLLAKKFNKDFWLNDLGFYALALDKNKTPCRVKSSNVGHCLFTGIVKKDYAQRVADVLMSPELFSGWGVRTIGENEALYNPMSYHNGTIWPHDSAIVGAGLARYGFKDHCIRILTGLFDASNLVDFHRLPELFCGFGRGPGKNPTIYPMSCAPQAWAAGSIFLLLAYCLGIKIKGESNEIILFHPKLPSYLDVVTIRNLKINETSNIDLSFINHGEDAEINILRRVGKPKVVVFK